MIQSIGAFWLLFPTSQWKTALSIWSWLPQGVLFYEEDIPFFSKEVVNLRLFFTHVETVLFGTPYFAATSYLSFPFHFTPIGLLFNLRFMGTIFLWQRTNNGLLEFTTLCFQKSNAWFEKGWNVQILVKKL